MTKSQLSLVQTVEMFISVSRRMVESKDMLTQADKAIGDGDHGVGMARGFDAICAKLEASKFKGLSDLFAAIGSTLMSSVGGAAGAIFGSFFQGAATSLSGRLVFDSEALSLMLGSGLKAVQSRGRARPGDKTMVDTLQPAAQKARELSTAPLADSLPAVAEAACQGMENTKNMVARIGKAKTLGERSLGHADPGALSTSLILLFMSEYVTKEAAQ